jgi:hypothetical protein
MNGSSGSAGEPAAPAALTRVIEQARRICLDEADAPEAHRPDADAPAGTGSGEPADPIARRARALALCCGAPRRRTAGEGRLAEVVAESADRWTDAARRWAEA